MTRAQIRADLLNELADRMDAFADDTYSERTFPKPTPDDYRAINALLHRERGHQLDAVAADCYRHAIHVQANLLRHDAIHEAANGIAE